MAWDPRIGLFFRAHRAPPVQSAPAKASPHRAASMPLALEIPESPLRRALRHDAVSARDVKLGASAETVGSLRQQDEARRRPSNRRPGSQPRSDETGAERRAPAEPRRPRKPSNERSVSRQSAQRATTPQTPSGRPRANKPGSALTQDSVTQVRVAPQRAEKMRSRTPPSARFDRADTVLIKTPATRADQTQPIAVRQTPEAINPSPSQAQKREVPAHGGAHRAYRSPCVAPRAPVKVPTYKARLRAIQARSMKPAGGRAAGAVAGLGFLALGYLLSRKRDKLTEGAMTQDLHGLQPQIKERLKENNYAQLTHDSSKGTLYRKITYRQVYLTANEPEPFGNMPVTTYFDTELVDAEYTTEKKDESTYPQMFYEGLLKVHTVTVTVYEKVVPEEPQPSKQQDLADEMGRHGLPAGLKSAPRSYLTPGRA